MTYKPHTNVIKMYGKTLPSFISGFSANTLINRLPEKCQMLAGMILPFESFVMT